MCGGENKKYKRVGNECRLTLCSFVKSFLCLWSPVKMVYFFLVYVCLCLLCRVVLRLLVTVCSFALWRIRCTNLSKRTLFINCTTVYIRTSPAITQRCCYRALFFSVVLVCLFLSVVERLLASSFYFFSALTLRVCKK